MVSPMPFSPKKALELLREDGLVTLTPTGRARSLVEEVVGGPVKGSWWGHPLGKVIYACAVALAESGEAIAVKLIAGKVTFVHRLLWPALYRVATDEERRQAALAELDEPARALYRRVEAAGELRLDRVAPAPPAKAREALEKRLLVLTEDLHTEKGSHTKVLRSWSRWASEEVKRAAASMTLDEASAAVTCGGDGGATKGRSRSRPRRRRRRDARPARPRASR
jgi:hypothetical protein